MTAALWRRASAGRPPIWVYQTLAPAALGEPVALVWGAASDPINLAWRDKEARRGCIR
jgi:hypothetical protein